jgi:hypothetical protein
MRIAPPQQQSVVSVWLSSKWLGQMHDMHKPSANGQKCSNTVSGRYRQRLAKQSLTSSMHKQRLTGSAGGLAHKSVSLSFRG